MGCFVNLIKVNQPIDMVYNWVTTPSYWPKYHPLSKYIIPLIDYSPQINESFREGVSILSVNQEINWTVTKKEPPFYFEIEGYVSGFMGGTTIIKYNLNEFKNSTIFRREILIKRKNKIVGIMDKLLIEIFIKHDGLISLMKMKEILELFPKEEGK